MGQHNIEVGRGNAMEQSPVTSRWSYRPAIDLIEDTDGFTIFADMPGTTADEIRISCENRTLNIHGRVSPRQFPETEFFTHDFGVGDFDREFAVTDTVDVEAITAEYADGVLKLSLPKTERSKPRRIPVRSA